jgi:hypothetical protein
LREDAIHFAVEVVLEMSMLPTLPRRLMLHDDRAKDAFEDSTRFNVSKQMILAVVSIVLTVLTILLIL